MPGVHDSPDPLIARLLRVGADGESREVQLRAILDEHVGPLAGRLLAVEVDRGELSASEAEDLRAEVVLRILRKLRQVMDDPRAHSILNVDDYVSATTHNVVDDLKRRRDPLRSRLANRLRYVLAHSSGLGLWEGDICGLAAWEGRRDVVRVARPEAPAGARAEDTSHLRTLVEETLRRSGGPVTLEALVEAFANTMGLSRDPFVPDDALVDRGEPPESLSRLEAREYLERLWNEIAVLPVRQRRALLLQLKLEDGESALRVLAALGIATVHRMADTLAMLLPDLLALWNDLPLPDERIALMLGIERQKVINLRKSARDRLARRMARRR